MFLVFWVFLVELVETLHTKADTGKETNDYENFAIDLYKGVGVEVVVRSLRNAIFLPL